MSTGTMIDPRISNQVLFPQGNPDVGIPNVLEIVLEPIFYLTLKELPGGRIGGIRKAAFEAMSAGHFREIVNKTAGGFQDQGIS
jgi:hypothetical protein